MVDDLVDYLEDLLEGTLSFCLLLTRGKIRSILVGGFNSRPILLNPESHETFGLGTKESPCVGTNRRCEFEKLNHYNVENGYNQLPSRMVVVGESRGSGQKAGGGIYSIIVGKSLDNSRGLGYGFF